MAAFHNKVLQGAGPAIGETCPETFRTNQQTANALTK